MGEMADMALDEIEETDLERMRWHRGEMTAEEAYEAGIIDEEGFEITDEGI